MPTDDQCRAALKAMFDDGSYIQGFSYGPKFGPPHVIRNILKDREQEIWRGDNHDEMMKRIEIERMRLALAAVGL